MTSLGKAPSEGLRTDEKTLITSVGSVRYQKQVLPKAVGEEELVLSAGQTYHDEVNRNPKWAKYAERMQVQVSPHVKKMLAIGMHDFIWTLR